MNEVKDSERDGRAGLFSLFEGEITIAISIE
jgi:hypothetical protein